MKKFGIDLDNPDIDEDDLDKDNAVDFKDLPPEIQKHIKFVENNTLDRAAKNYLDRTHAFLKETFYKNNKIYSNIKYDFETISWHHTLLPAKIHRALCGFHEPVAEGDFSMCDAVAQFDICVKGIEESIEAFRNICANLSERKALITELISLLHNLKSRIEIMVESI